MNRITIVGVAIGIAALIGAYLVSYVYDDRLEGDTAVTSSDVKE